MQHVITGFHREEKTKEASQLHIPTKTFPSHWKVVKLSNEQLFAFENGIWTGKQLPFIDCPIIRNTNFTDNGTLNLMDVAVISIEQRQLEKKRLIKGDIIIERSGGGPTQPVGRVAFFDLDE